MASANTTTALFILEKLPGPVGLLGSAGQHLLSLLESGTVEELAAEVRALDRRLRRLESLPSRRIRGNPARILEYTLRRAVGKLWDLPDAEEVIQACGVSPESFRDSAQELDAIGILEIDPNLNSPIGIARARLRPEGYLRAGPGALPDLPVVRETLHTLSAAQLLTRSLGMVPTQRLLKATGIPLPRLDLTLLGLRDLGLLEGSGPGDERWGHFMHVHVTPVGRRALRGDDPLF